VFRFSFGCCTTYPAPNSYCVCSLNAILSLALRVIFHLVDARIGPTDEDAKIMQKVGSIIGSKQQRNHAKYVIILTKADKNVKSASSEKNPGKVSESVRNKLVETMKANQVGYAPIVVTSAETRLGRDEVWKYLRLAAEQ
jgi:GTP-binding protein EngB required for normal cell division